MYIKLNVDDEGMITEIIPEGDVKLSFDGVIAFCMSTMEAACKDYLEAYPDDGEDLYDSIDALFYRFMERSFPEIQPREFDLSDAGLLYAQDKIIHEAAEKGMTYEEALKHYEEEAKAYVMKNSGVLS